MSLIPGEPPLALAPSLERDLYVPWLDRRDRAMLPRVGPRPSIPLVAQSLADASIARDIAASVRKDWAVGLALDPQPYFFQVERESRPHGFDQLTFAVPEGFDPARDRLSQQEAERYATSVVDAELEALATLLITPSHIRRSPADAETTSNDIALARAAAAYFASERLDEPSPADPWRRPRQLFAGITFELPVLLDAAARADLGARYASLDVNGFWVRIAGLRDAASPTAVAATAAFLLDLRRRSHLPIVLVGAGNISLAFSSCGVSICYGISWNEYFSFPPSRRGGEEDGFTTVIYHRQLLRNLQTNGAARARAQRAFWAFPCDCGHHEPYAPPGRGERRPHTLTCRLSQFEELFAVGATARWPVIARWLGAAEEGATRLGYPRSIYAGWNAVRPASESDEAAEPES